MPLSKINYYVTAYIQDIKQNFVIVKYNIKLNPFPSDNPVVFLEYTINFPDNMIINQVAFSNKQFSKEINFRIKKYNNLKTLIIKPKLQKVVLDSVVDINIITSIPFNKVGNNIRIAFIPSFQKINNLAPSKSFVFFQPYINTNYSALVRFSNLTPAFNQITNNLINVLQGIISNLLTSIVVIIKLCLLLVFISLLIVYNILWIILKLLINKNH